MTHLPLFRFRPWNNGMCCISFYISVGIGSGNVLVSKIRLIVHWPLRNKLKWNISHNSPFLTGEIAFQRAACKIPAISSRPQSVNKLFCVTGIAVKRINWAPFTRYNWAPVSHSGAAAFILIKADKQLIACSLHNSVNSFHNRLMLRW